MDNLELSLQNIQQKIDELNQQLTETQNQKLTAEVHLQNEKESFDSLCNELKEMTGLTDLNEISEYVNNKHNELDNILGDLQQVSSMINNNYIYTENDVINLKNIINKYGIQITGE